VNMNRRKLIPSGKRKQRGQSMVEYTAIAFVLGVALFAPIPNLTPSQTVGQLLAGKIHDLYDNVSFFVSLP
jgi:hypothetical protein